MEVLVILEQDIISVIIRTENQIQIIIYQCYEQKLKY